MAFRSSLTNNVWKSMLVGTRIGGNRRLASSSSSTTAGNAHASSSSKRSEYLKGEYAPIYIVMGFVVVALAIGTHTAKQNILHSPAVNFNKKKRETVFEVDDPDTVISSADKFINKSFLRKLAHIQDDTTTLSDPVHPNPFTRPRNAVTLKTVGVDPSRH